MMDFQTDSQILQLGNMQQGQMMSVAITGATAGGNCVLEFKNGSDTNWSEDPNFDGTVTAGVLVENVKCLSAYTRIRFLSDPVGFPYWVSVVYDAVPNC